MRRLLAVVRLIILPLLPGCGVFQHLNVEPLASGAERPGNVAALVAVSDGDEPLGELSPADFRVYENEQLVALDRSELTLLDPSLVSSAQVVLLVDMSHATTIQARQLVRHAAENFAEKVLPKEAVSVLAFDGGANLIPVATLARGSQVTALPALESITPRDPSRNLNGAVVAGVERLKSLLAQAGKVVKLGTLVVYASGPDVAGRVTGDQARDAVWESNYDAIVIGVGSRADAIEDFAKQGLVRAQSPSTLPIAFDEAASRVLAQLSKHYLVSYCSPARAGIRRLRLEVSYTNKSGDERHGDFETEFDARGFGPGCNPQQPPRLTLMPGESRPAASNKSGEKPRKTPAGATSEPSSDDEAPVAPPRASGYAP